MACDGSTMENQFRSQRPPYFLNPPSGFKSNLLIYNQLFFLPPARSFHDGDRRRFRYNFDIASLFVAESPEAFMFDYILQGCPVSPLPWIVSLLTLENCLSFRTC